MRYLVIIEKGESSWGAHVPDLPGCIAVAETRKEVRALIKEAIDLFRKADVRRHRWLTSDEVGAISENTI